MPRPVSAQRCRLGLVLTVWLALTPVAPSHGQPASSPEADAERLRQVQEQISSHHDKITESHIQALNLEQELHRIDSQIAQNQATLSDLQAKLTRQEDHIRQKEEEIAAIVAKKEATASHIQKRLAAFYQTGEVGIVNALFSANDLGELVNMQEYVQALFRYDQEVLAGYRSQVAMLAKAKDALTLAKEDLEVLIDQVREGEEALVTSRGERDAVLAQVRAEEELYRQALRELETAASKLGAAIDRARELEAKASRQKPLPKAKATASPAIDTGFPTFKGRLPPPALGRIIRPFGPYRDRFGTELQADGLDLAVPPGTTVTAIHGGKVIFADQLPGYGNLVIIDHGAQYYSLVAGLATMTKGKDDSVRAGEAIGTFDQPSGQINPGLHVEIRHGSVPIDPLPWLDASQIEAEPTATGTDPAPSP